MSLLVLSRFDARGDADTVVAAATYAEDHGFAPRLDPSAEHEVRVETR